MTRFALTEKSNALLETKVIDGELYFLSERNEKGEFWVYMSPVEDVEDKCANCGYTGVALDKHHIHGRKHSEETIVLCANCHRELHDREGFK